MESIIRVSKSVVGQEESEAVENVIRNIGYLGMGEEVKNFENELELYIGNPDYKAVCVNTGTSALHIAIESVTNPGDEILVPSFTFIATYQAITAAGCIPISCEINKDTLLMDLNDARERVTNKTKVILPVLYASNPGNLKEIYALANEFKLRVIEDSAHAFGCNYNGKKIGAQGDIICFSFDGIKNITSGEGGAIFTSDVKVMEYVKDARLLGVEKDSEKRYKSERSWDFDVSIQGYRYHMSNIFAAIGRVQLRRFEKEFAISRKNIAKKYSRLLKNNTNIKLIEMDYENIVPHIFPILIKGGKRDQLFDKLKENGIQCGMHYKPNHLLTKYKTSYSLPVTEKAYDQVLTLPLHPEITEESVNKICNLLTINKL
jgi:dTDP-4-amino-4,6-dideoxygalactose transaminase